jgi:hypothetical protein
MFEKSYKAAMRNGSRLLFALAAILFVAVLAQSLLAFARPNSFGQSEALSTEWLVLATQIFSACSAAALPLFGAVLIDRIDRRLGVAAEREDPH